MCALGWGSGPPFIASKVGSGSGSTPCLGDNLGSIGFQSTLPLLSLSAFARPARHQVHRELRPLGSLSTRQPPPPLGLRPLASSSSAHLALCGGGGRQQRWQSRRQCHGLRPPALPLYLWVAAAPRLPASPPTSNNWHIFF